MSSVGKRFILFATNATVAVMWLRVLLVLFEHGWDGIIGSASGKNVCEQSLAPRVLVALGVSAVELVNALIGLTRSNPVQVLVFTAVRTMVECLIAPLCPCNQWQHVFTVACWAFGDVCRFGCFAVDAVVADSPTASWYVKAVRYTVGPILFPFGAGGEALLTLVAASTGHTWMYGLVPLWPVGFYPLMKQLLKQSKKHFSTKVKGR
eukprot:TRINITY_DN61804_c0_g1_i1.p1 TRINITY_DN61804_c0_g1~~TRINITY_DN61804_c0_g1_i1.p1  ORF type:complete len:231 (+),score=22.29 TRINITY_DN61804_c0_g1_i1:74-694(+)